MTDLYIHFNAVTSANKCLNSSVSRMEEVQDVVRQVQNGLAPKILSRRRIASQLTACRESADTIRRQMKNLYSAVDRGATRYKSSEESLKRGVPDNSTVTAVK